MKLPFILLLLHFLNFLKSNIKQPYLHLMYNYYDTII